MPAGVRIRQQVRGHRGRAHRRRRCCGLHSRARRSRRRLSHSSTQRIGIAGALANWRCSYRRPERGCAGMQRLHRGHARSLPPMMSISRIRSPRRAEMRNSSGSREGTLLLGWRDRISCTVPRRIMLGPFSRGAPPESERSPRRSSMAAVCSRRLCPRVSTRVGTVRGLPSGRYLSHAWAAFWAKARRWNCGTARNAGSATP